MLNGIKKSALTLTAVVAATLPFAANAADPEAGKQKATTVCAACHGATGKAPIPIYPNLAGQNEAYLVSSMKAYKNKERTGGQAIVMQGQAMALSDEDIANLAAYYSKQTP